MLCMCYEYKGIWIMTPHQKIPATVFREYDIRGKVDHELFLDQIYALGRSIAYFFKSKQSSVKTVAIGIDGRIHSPYIKQELTQAMRDSGFDVTFIGLCPSPALYFAMHTDHYDAGLMVTASHNPKEYNGIKIVLGKENVCGAQIQDLYRCYQRGDVITTVVTGNYAEQCIVPAYVAWLADHFSSLKNSAISAVIDCGNGAAGTVIPLLVERMGWQSVQVLYSEIDGTYPHHEADPVKIENMRDAQQVMEQKGHALAIGLDGDADRMAPMTRGGILVPGDILLAVFAQSLLAHQESLGDLQSRQATVVFDIKSSQVLIDYLKNRGIQGVMSASGHSIIKQEMKKHHACLAGELSCHFFFNDRYFGYDDGIYAMLRLFEIILQGTSLDDLVARFPACYTSIEYRIPCDEDKKKLVVQTVKDIFAQKKEASLITIDGVRVTMPYGWGLLRASNTQPMLSLRFESEGQQGLQHIKNDVIDALLPFYAKDNLVDYFQG